MSQNDMKKVMEDLARGIDNLQVVKVPPPHIFRGFEDSISIELFFEMFERHCRSIYKESEVSWLQVLPNFLSGESRALTLAYGLATPYTTVKEKLIQKFKKTPRLDQGDINDIFSAIRRPEESYGVFAVRLEMLANRWLTASPEVRKELVRARFLDLLDGITRNKLQLHFGSNAAETPLSQIITFVTIAETQLKQRQASKMITAAASAEVGERVSVKTDETEIKIATGAKAKENKGASRANTVQCEYCNMTGHTIEQCRRKQSRCFRCRKSGHFARDCTEVEKKTSTRSVQDEDKFQPRQCPACGKRGHAPWECEEVWRRFLSCQSCGSWTHSTSQCDRNRGPVYKTESSPSQNTRALQPPGN